jgi:AraC-like DNA-binding protein
MLQQSLFLANFTVLILSIIVFIELLVVFKRPIQLKLLFLGISFSFFLNALLYLIQPYIGYVRGINEFPSTFLGALSILLFSYLCYQKIVKKALIVSLFIIFIHLLVLIKFNFISKIDPSIPLESKLILGNNKYVYRSVFFITGLFLVNLFYFFKLLKNYNSENIYFKQLRFWTYWFISTVFVIWFINQLFLFSFIQKELVKIGVLICHFTFILLIFYRPRFLNHSNFAIILDGSFKNISKTFSQDDFVKLFFIRIYYLNKTAELDDFCISNKINEEEVKDLVINFYKLSFSDLVNKSRVEYFINLIKTGDNAKLSLESLAQMSGFNSRQHLYKWFKKFHGGSPSDLL